MAAGSPLWRRIFDDVERRVGTPLAATTRSPQFQLAALKAGRVRRAVVAPVQTVAGFGLHLVGLPSHSEVRELRRELHGVQRELTTMRLDQSQAERDEREPQ